MKRFYDLKRYAQTGIASPGMKAFDKMFAISAFGSKFPITTLTGVDQITFDSDGKPLTALSIIGNMQQTGTPTQTVPIQPEETGDRTGNLWNEEYPNISPIIKYVPVYVGDGSFTLSTTTPYDKQVANLFLLSGNVESGASTPANGAWRNHNVTAQSDSGYITIAYRQYSDTTSPADCKTMLNTGSTDLPYEPYGYKIPVSCGGQTYNVYLTEPLRKIGDYGDTVSSDGTVTRRIKKLVFDGTENWNMISGGKKFYKQYTDYLKEEGITCVCTHFAATNNVTGSGGINIGQVAFYTTSLSRFIIGTEFLSEDDLKTFLADEYVAGHPVTVWYVLETATTETVTVPTIQTAKGANTLSIGTTLPPSEVSITGHIKAV